MTTALISGACAVIAALLTALVTTKGNLRSKRLELLGNSEERKAADLARGYDTMLAAADLCWHYNCHSSLRYYGGINPPFDWEEEFTGLQNHIVSLYSRAIDLLKANSLHYETVAPSLDNLMQMTLHKQTVSLMEAMPRDYEEARQLVIEMSRIDARLNKPTKNFWKKFFRRNKPAPMEDLAAEDRLRRAYALLKRKDIDGFMSQEDDVVIAFIQGFQKNPPIFAASLAQTSARIDHWRQLGIISQKTPCDNLGFPCYQEAQEKTSERHGDECD